MRRSYPTLLALAIFAALLAPRTAHGVELATPITPVQPSPAVLTAAAAADAQWSAWGRDTASIAVSWGVFSDPRWAAVAVVPQTIAFDAAWLLAADLASTCRILVHEKGHLLGLADEDPHYDGVMTAAMWTMPMPFCTALDPEPPARPAPLVFVLCPPPKPSDPCITPQKGNSRRVSRYEKLPNRQRRLKAQMLKIKSTANRTAQRLARP